MTTLCEHCLRWAPKTREQLATRKSNTGEKRDRNPMKCPECGGTDWITTDARVMPRKLPVRWWHALFN